MGVYQMKNQDNIFKKTYKKASDGFSNIVGGMMSDNAELESYYKTMHENLTKKAKFARLKQTPSRIKKRIKKFVKANKYKDNPRWVGYNEGYTFERSEK